MITSLDGLVDYTRRTAEAWPELHHRIEIRRPGCTNDEIDRIKKVLPGSPTSYLAVISTIHIDGISIGAFQLVPSSAMVIGMAEKLSTYNDPTVTPIASRYRTHGVYQVASWEADPIALAYNATTFKVGQVVKYNAGNPAARPTVLADDFAQFLLLAGTLDEIRDRYVDQTDSGQAISDFSAYLDPIVSGRQDDMMSTWKQIAEVVLT